MWLHEWLMSYSAYGSETAVLGPISQILISERLCGLLRSEQEEFFLCGIAGFAARQPFREYCAPSLAQAMAKYLIHRGPDASSVWLVAEGCRARRRGECGGRRWQ